MVDKVPTPETTRDRRHCAAKTKNTLYEKGAVQIQWVLCLTLDFCKAFYKPLRTVLVSLVSFQWRIPRKNNPCLEEYMKQLVVTKVGKSDRCD